MKNTRLLEEGLKAIANAGMHRLFGEVIEVEGEELKQKYISYMTEKLTVHVKTICERSGCFDGIEVKETVDLKGACDE